MRCPVCTYSHVPYYQLSRCPPFTDPSSRRKTVKRSMTSNSKTQAFCLLITTAHIRTGLRFASIVSDSPELADNRMDGRLWGSRMEGWRTEEVGGMRRGTLGLERKKHGRPPQFRAQFTLLHVQACMETYIHTHTLTHTHTQTHKSAHAYTQIHLTETYTTNCYSICTTVPA